MLYVHTIAWQKAVFSLLQNAEHVTLLDLTDKLTSEIAADPLSVSARLVAAGLIPESLHASIQLQDKDKDTRANELVEAIIKQIKECPNRFEAFLAVLNEFPWLLDIAKLVIQVYNAEEGQDQVIFQRNSSLHSSCNQE